MKKLLIAMFWMISLSVAIFGAAAGLIGMVFMRAHAIDVLGSAGLSLLAAITGAYSSVALSCAASDAQVEAFTLAYRLRNWWARRAWRRYAAALAGQSTAASFEPYTRAVNRSAGVAAR